MPEPRAKLVAAEGCATLLISLRAHGDSTGDVNDIGYSARHDVVAAVDFLERRRPGRPVIIQARSIERRGRGFRGSRTRSAGPRVHLGGFLPGPSQRRPPSARTTSAARPRFGRLPRIDARRSALPTRRRCDCAHPVDRGNPARGAGVDPGRACRLLALHGRSPEHSTGASSGPRNTGALQAGATHLNLAGPDPELYHANPYSASCVRLGTRRSAAFGVPIERN